MDRVERPGIITLLAILQLLGAVVCLCASLALYVAAVLGGSSLGTGTSAMIAAVVGAIGVAQLFCGIGLLNLKPYGRTVQLVFAWIGLIGIPIGTVISILILIYLSKPGIKLLFSGRPLTQLNAEETRQVAAVSGGGSTIVVVMVMVILGPFFVGIVAAIAVPGLLRARIASNEAGAISSLETINQGQQDYARLCARGGYAVTLRDLAKPARDRTSALLGSPLDANDIETFGYRFSLERSLAPDVREFGRGAYTCNDAAHSPANGYFAMAVPASPGSSGNRYFATDHHGIIYESSDPISNPIQESEWVRKVQPR